MPPSSARSCTPSRPPSRRRDSEDRSEDRADLKRRQDQHRQGWLRQINANWADQHRKKLVELYGEELGKQVKYAEAFEVCEYGRRPSPQELRKLFPINPPKK